jgi:hypothetical protein
MIKAETKSLLLYVSLTFCATTYASPVAPKTLTIKQAASLTRIAVRNFVDQFHPGGPFTLESMAIEHDNRFHSFEALGVWDSSQPGSAVIGNYTVNMTTGQVWDLSSCGEIKFPRLQNLRRRYVGHELIKAKLKKNLTDPPRNCA